MKVADMHCDTILSILEAKQNHKTDDLKSSTFQLDLNKMTQGDYLLQNFAMFINLKHHENPFEYCKMMIRTMKEEAAKYPDIIRIVTNYDEIAENQKNNLISAMLTVEEGGAIEGKMDNLIQLYEQGIRMMTLTWNYENEIGFPNCLTKDKVKAEFGQYNTECGLTPFGFDVVTQMQEIGMIVDVSHLSDAGFYDVLSVVKKPFVASHSNARAICGHCRNLSDDMIRKLAEHGGVMGLNYEPEFLFGPGESDEVETELERMAAHVKHIIKVGGTECLGLGSDFDGINIPKVIKDGSCLPYLAEKLKKEGLNTSQIEQIFYKNVLRLYKDTLH